MGEELRVLWEIEPRAETLPGYGLADPDGFGDPKRLDAFLLAARRGAVSSADLNALRARSGAGSRTTSSPLVRAIQIPWANLPIVDDVGLGKTIESGLGQAGGRALRLPAGVPAWTRRLLGTG